MVPQPRVWKRVPAETGRALGSRKVFLYMSFFFLIDAMVPQKHLSKLGAFELQKSTQNWRFKPKIEKLISILSLKAQR